MLLIYWPLCLMFCTAQLWACPYLLVPSYNTLCIKCDNLKYKCSKIWNISLQGFEEALEKMHKDETVTSCDTVTAANTLVTLSSGHPTGHLVTSSHAAGHLVTQNAVPLTLGLPNTINTKQSVQNSITSTPRPGSGASGSYDSDTYQLPDGAGSDIKIKDRHIS